MTAVKDQKAQETTVPLEEVVFSLYQSQGKIYPKSVSGIFNNWRWIMVWLTQLFFYGVPWLEWGNRQAMLLIWKQNAFLSLVWFLTHKI